MRTQQIIAHETGVASTVDPFGGSYYLETLTAEIERRAAEYLDRIERLGGMLPAIEQGFVQREIAEAAYREQRQVETGDRVIVGVNRFETGDDRIPPLLRVEPAVIEGQRARLRRVRAERDGRRVETALRVLADTARGRDNLLPPILECVRAYATVGEICDTLRACFGVYQPAAVV